MSKIKLTCDNCGEEMRRYESQINDDGGNYCSLDCAMKDRNADTKQEIECDYCGKTIIKFEADINDTYNFCSRECVAKFKTEKGYKTISCDNCGQKFKRKKSKIRDTHNFCSLECSHEFQKTGKEKVQCSQCSKEIERWPYQVKNNNHFYCSKECEAKWLSENQTGENHHNYTDKVEVRCAQCGSSIMVYPYRTRNTTNFFCSQDCQGKWWSEHYNGRSNFNWQGGHVEYYGPSWLKQRRKALKRDNHTCQLCGTRERKLDRELDVHHKKPFRTFRKRKYRNQSIKSVIDEFNWKEANKLSNLISLCPDCHKKVEYNDNIECKSSHN